MLNIFGYEVNQEQIESM